MRIAFIGDGASVHNHFMIDWFIRAGHEVCFLTDTPDEKIRCQCVVVTTRSGSPLRHLQAAWKARSFLKQWKPDVVHSHNVTGYGYWGALAGVQPLVLTAWGSDILLLPGQGWLTRSLVQYSLRKAHFITADAQSLCDATQNLATQSLDVRLLQWGIDLSEFDQTPDPEFSRTLRADARFVFLSNRRLRSLYNIDVIIRAFAEVVSEHPEARLVIGGDDENRAALEALVASLGIGNAVLFTGWLTRQQVFDSLHGADAWISVPSSDSTPLSLLEAFAAKLPVVVSDLPAMREWVTDGQNGYLVPVQDAGALAHAMKRMIVQAPLMNTWGEANRKLVEKKASRETEMNRLLGWYREITDSVPS